MVGVDFKTQVANGKFDFDYFDDTKLLVSLR